MSALKVGGSTAPRRSRAGENWRRERNGVALVIVLAFIVLLTGLIVAFFTQAVGERELSSASSQQAEVELLIHGALSTVVADLRQEISAGSTMQQTDLSVFYVPKPGLVMPAQVGPADSSGLPANLLKQSAYAQPFYRGPDYDPRFPASNRACGPSVQSASTVPSLNGRAVSLGQWNRPLLLPKADPLSETNLTPVQSGPDKFTAPDWILIARNGMNPTQWRDELKERSGDSFVIGRYAYTIYDEGGLLDINVAGHPVELPATQCAYKSALAFADLAQLPGLRDFPSALRRDQIINGIVGWRNYASARPGGLMPLFSFDRAQSTRFHDAVLSNTTGFLTVANRDLFESQTDRMFSSRQELIGFLQQALAINARERASLQNALQYLGTFSRDLNQPSFHPDPNRPALVGGPLRGGNNAYSAADRRADAINPSFLNVTAQVAFPREDGSTAIPGEPLVKRRFPLNRLDLLHHDSTASLGSKIHRCFGLTRARASQPWTYRHGANGRIFRLSEVAALQGARAREPDFVELLKAAMSAGSLAKGANQGSSPALSAQHSRDTSLDRQVLQIAANIIDQTDVDGYPTQIVLKASDRDGEVYGIENLPGLYRFRLMAVRTNPTDGTLLITPEIWNPHDVNSPLGIPRPTEFRVTAEGEVQWSINGEASGGNAIFTPQTTEILFNDALGKFREPVLLRERNQPAGYEVLPGAGNRPGSVASFYRAPFFYSPASLGAAHYLGFHAGDFRNLWPQAAAATAEVKLHALDSTPGITFRLEYRSSGAWKPCAERITPATLSALLMDGPLEGVGSIGSVSCGMDPRSDRFGMVVSQPGPSQFGSLAPRSSSGPWPPDPSGRVDAIDLTRGISSSNRPDSLGDDGDRTVDDAPNKSPSQGWFYRSFKPGLLSQNLYNQRHYYADADGIVRRAMGAYATNDTSARTTSVVGLPMALYNHRCRPKMLNRPFRSVAELAYVFRGTPWKNIDLFTPESGDTALLDLFCLTGNGSSDGLVAGKVNLNTRQVPVLTAILAGAAVHDSSSVLEPPLALPQAEAIARALVARTTSHLANKGPMRNVAELVGKWVPDFINANLQPYDGFSEDLGGLYSGGTGAATNILQPYREAAIRALVDVGTTRVWNLMIDMVAQTGRFPQGAKALHEFNVSGERRYWLHIAIDRSTGRVLDQQLERVDAE